MIIDYFKFIFCWISFGSIWKGIQEESKNNDVSENLNSHGWCEFNLILSLLI